MLDIDEKAFIISKMLSGHKKQSHNRALKDHVKKLIGGLSEQDSLKIMQTNPYMQTTPTALSLGNNIIDYSNTDIALHNSLSKRARTKTPINSLFVDATRKFPLGDVPRLESEPELLVDFSGFTQATDQSLWEKGEKYEKKDEKKGVKSVLISRYLLNQKPNEFKWDHKHLECGKSFIQSVHRGRRLIT